MQKLRLREVRDFRVPQLEEVTENLNSGISGSQTSTGGAQASLRGGDGGTHSTGHRPERSEPLGGVGRVAAPGIPAWVLAPLQHILLPLEASVLKAHPPVNRGLRVKDVRDHSP